MEDYLGVSDSYGSATCGQHLRPSSRKHASTVAPYKVKQRFGSLVRGETQMGTFVCVGPRSTPFGGNVFFAWGRRVMERDGFPTIVLATLPLLVSPILLSGKDGTGRQQRTSTTAKLFSVPHRLPVYRRVHLDVDLPSRRFPMANKSRQRRKTNPHLLALAELKRKLPRPQIGHHPLPADIARLLVVKLI